jgi:thiamine-phosphate pyrophosphorylase
MPPRYLPGPPLLCLTQDGLGLSHGEQVARLLAAGARWIQLRLKGAGPAAWLATAGPAAEACRRHGARLIVNDSVEVALAAGADGVHLGSTDFDWRRARERLGPERIIGGTVNNPADVERALAAGCLDYVGVGPLRFTTTKRNLSPVLGLDGVADLIGRLSGLPAWVIGGVEPDDLPALRAAGAAGAAVSSRLYLGERIEENVRAYLEAWDRPAPSLAHAQP